MLDQLKKSIDSAIEYPDLIPALVVSALKLDKHSRYLFEASERLIASVEADPGVVDRADALQQIRRLGLDDFAYFLWTLPDPRFPKLSRLLPRMASEEAQRHWTGNSGVKLLSQSTTFVRSLLANYAKLANQSPAGRDVLDFGCGYGRIARLMYHVTDEAGLVGVDPWDKSIALCKETGMGENFFQSEYLPSELPVGNRTFDIMYAFSVFTHLSQRAAQTTLSALRKYVRPSGILAITIRPAEYWSFARHIPSAASKQLRGTHDREGFAFYAHSREKVDGDVTYGDTSMSLDWLAKNNPGWKVAAIDRSFEDRMQLYIFLQPT
jgi:SAM-dependent methyltransferase